jgi:NitT/TauT family transport system permease protein
MLVAEGSDTRQADGTIHDTNHGMISSTERARDFDDTGSPPPATSREPIGEAPLFAAPKERFLELRSQASRGRTVVLGLVGALAFFAIWELGHYATPAASRKFLPSVEQVIAALAVLFLEKDFLHDVLISCYRIVVSFLAASAVAVPLGIAMGCFQTIRALVAPTVSGWRYLPAASFIPLLLVWFGPTDLAKIALLFLGVIFFLIALIVDNTTAVPNEYVEAALTMGAKRKQVVLGVVVPAAAPAIFDSMRNMIAVGWTYLVIAEIVGAQDGIGAVMMRAGRFLNVDVIMAGILMIGILGVLTDLAFRGIARLALPWHSIRRS